MLTSCVDVFYDKFLDFPSLIQTLHYISGQVLQLDELKLGDIGPLFEHHEVFPARTNTGWFFFS